MDAILSKFTNLGYELWGIFVPGLIMLLMLVFVWWCAGPIAELVTFGFLPEATVNGVTGFMRVLNNEIRAGLVFGIAVVVYFLGHLLHWFSRSPKSKPVKIGWIMRVAQCLRFSVPKSVDSFDPYLQPLLDEAKGMFGLSVEATWPQFYPVAKAYLSANLQTSLVSTYQNKYTLHRSLTTASVVWFWLSIGCMLIALAAGGICGFGGPKWFPLLCSVPISLILVYGFSDSYQYNWKLFGNSIITEVFMIKRSRENR